MTDTTEAAQPEQAPPHAPDNVPVIVALSRVMAEVQAIGKLGKYDAAGTKYNFRGVDAVVNAVGPALRKHGVVVMPVVEDVSYRDTQTSGGKNARGCAVRVKYVIYGPAGDRLEDAVVVVAESLDNSDKGTAKAMSVAYRTLWLQLLCIPTDDPDPDADRPTLGKARAAKPSGPATETPPSWIKSVRQRIANAKTRAQITLIWKQVGQAVADGVCTVEDSDRLKAEMTTLGNKMGDPPAATDGPDDPPPVAQRASARRDMPTPEPFDDAADEAWLSGAPVVNGRPS